VVGRGGGGGKGVLVLCRGRGGVLVFWSGGGLVCMDVNVLLGWSYQKSQIEMEKSVNDGKWGGGGGGGESQIQKERSRGEAMGGGGGKGIR